ncbi:MAG: hypothetical protein FJ109_14225 [Deltaproteobacteria bacterium]|nr:hypothetical protein [Deltaproteobacteria bacterium]
MRRVAIIVLNIIMFWVALPAGIAGMGLLLDRWLGLPEPGLAIRGVGAGIAALGLAFSLWAIVVLRLRGKGLPISSLPPPDLVVTGPYAWVRHPIYTGYVFLAAGAGLAAGSWGIAGIVVPLVAVAWFATWVKLYEEPGLLRRFGNAYRIHAERMPLLLPLRPVRGVRWLVLRLFRLFFHVTVEGGENVPRRGPVLLYSDHLSYQNFIFAQYATTRPMRIPVTAEVFRKPLQRAFMRMMGGIPTRRFCADPASLLALADEIGAGGVVGIAIEGERSWTGEMALPAANVVRNMLELSAAGRCGAEALDRGVQVVPLAFCGAYRLWPRWAGGADRKTRVVIRIGKPYYLRDSAEAVRQQGEDLADACARVLRERVVALRLPDGLLADPGRLPAARPELALWRCPTCSGEETLSLESRRWLSCAGCGTRWDFAGGNLTVVEPADRSGESGTLAGWCRRAGCGPGDGPLSSGSPTTGGGGASNVALAAECELREDSEARLTLQVLRSLGTGMAVLRSDGLEWKRGERVRRYRPEDILTVTTERNDTLQLGVGRGVVQLVFGRASPWRWQKYVAELAGGRCRK